MNNTTINNKQQNSKNNFFQCLNSTIKSDQSQNQSKFSSLTLNNSMTSRKRNYYYGGNPSANPNDEKFNSTAAITTAKTVLIENSKKSKLYNEDKKQFSYLPLPIPSKNNSSATITSSSFNISSSSPSSLVKNGCSSKNITNISLNTSNFDQKKFSTIKNSEIKSTIDQNKNNKNTINNSRNMQLITGDIKFILNIHKNYKESIDALYEVYAKLIKIIKGNHSSEHYLFLRNHTGPVLKGIYYEIDRKLPIIEIDQNVCCVGRFNTQNQFQIFKIRSIPFQSPPDDYITRMHNICGFSINKNHQK